MSHICIAYYTTQRCPHGAKPNGIGGGALWSKIWRLILHVNHQCFGEGGPHIYLVTWWTVTDLGVGTERSKMVSKKYGIKDFFFAMIHFFAVIQSRFFSRFFHEGIGIKVLQKTHEIHSGCLWIIFLMPGLFSRKIDGDEFYAPIYIDNKWLIFICFSTRCWCLQHVLYNQN